MDELPVVDRAQIEKLNQWGGPSLKQKMVDLFTRHAAERLEEVRIGLAEGVPKTAERGAHTLKSSAGNVGASRVQHLAQEAETLAETGRMDELQALLPRLEEAFRVACDALEAMIEEEEE